MLHRRIYVMAALAFGLGLSSLGLYADEGMAKSDAGANTPATQAPKETVKTGVKKGPLSAANELMEAKKYDEAIAAYEAIGVQKSKKAETWRLNNEGLCYIRSGRFKEAIPLLEKSVEADPNNHIAWNNLGASYENSGELDKAKDAYKKSVELAKGSNAKAEFNLKRAEMKADKQGEKQAAVDAKADSSSAVKEGEASMKDAVKNGKEEAKQ